MKLLYVLALFQLIAGPLVIFQVTLLCRLTLSEAGERSWGAAFSEALNGDEFHALVRNAKTSTKANPSSPAPSPPDVKGKALDLKATVRVWTVFGMTPPPCAGLVPHGDRSRPWTPVWPQAPPGPPPRVG